MSIFYRDKPRNKDIRLHPVTLEEAASIKSRYYNTAANITNVSNAYRRSKTVITKIVDNKFSINPETQQIVLDKI